MANMQNPDLSVSLSSLLQALLDIQTSNKQCAATFTQLRTSLEQATTSANSNTHLTQVISSLTQHTLEVCAKHSVKDDGYDTQLLTVLADTTRGYPEWRSLFGYQSVQNGTVSEACVLDTARDIIARCGRPFATNFSRKLLNSALRLVANCCADNNINRKQFLENDGMSQLIKLLERRIEVDTLIPAIYNICNDYEDPDSVIDITGKLTEANIDGEVPAITLSFAATKLAMACADRTDLNTFELLLATRSVCSADRREYLAELVEIACSPAAINPSQVFGDLIDSEWKWTFKLQQIEHHTLEAARDLAQESIGCRLHVCRSVLYLLAQEETWETLLSKPYDRVWTLVQVFCLEADIDDHEIDQYQEELAACHKDFVKMFYELTGIPAFANKQGANQNLIHTCMAEISSEFWLWSTRSSSADSSQTTSELSRICALIIFAQLAASPNPREMMLNSSMLIGTLPQIIKSKDNPDVLYPAIKLVSRLATSPGNLIPMVDKVMLESMRHPLIGKGLGLIVPYETVNTYRLILKGRPQYMPDYANITANGGIVTDMLALFDRTIEAGTKLEIGQFFIEMLRTMFPTAKAMDESDLTPINQPDIAFMKVLEDHTAKLGEVFDFVCTEAEPKEHRIHGWFGLGMLSVWQNGRRAIVDAIKNHDLGEAMVKASETQEGPVPQNLKIVLAKMQLCSHNDMPEKVQGYLMSAAQNLGVSFTLH